MFPLRVILFLICYETICSLFHHMSNVCLCSCFHFVSPHPCAGRSCCCGITYSSDVPAGPAPKSAIPPSMDLPLAAAMPWAVMSPCPQHSSSGCSALQVQYCFLGCQVCWSVPVITRCYIRTSCKPICSKWVIALLERLQFSFLIFQSRYLL